MLAPADNISVRFLKLVLPEQGYYIAAVKRPGSKGGFRHIFTASVEELWSVLEEHDRNGWETYHACASFKEALSDPPGATQKRLGRTQANALGAKAFWIDLDAGKDDKGKAKPYSTQHEAAAALKRFLKATGLPTPVLVSSGYGLHVYWPLAEMLDPATWKRYAEGLKALCEKHGLHTDPARTADISSVLRTPGTHNHKRGTTAPVSCNPEFLQVQQQPLERFATLLDAGRQGAAPMTGLAGPQPARARAGGAAKAGSVSADLLGGLDDYPPAFAADIVNRCGQLGEIRDKRGAVPEPLWHAALGVLAFCEDGAAVAHSWSDPEWHAAIDEKLDRVRQLTGATTCEKLQSLNPTVCAACKHRGAIKSPIALATRQSAAVSGPGVAAPGGVKVSFDVTNTGRRPGTETPQIYVGFPPSIGEPPQRLAAFAKVTLAPGETQPVTLTLPPAAFSFWDIEGHRFATAAGDHTIAVGNSSRHLPLRASVHLAGTR